MGQPQKTTALPDPRESSPFKLSIIPDPPTADGCLKVLVSGAPEAEYRWAVNGQDDPGQINNLLCDAVKRGDDVVVTVSVAGKTATASFTVANAPPRITEVAVFPEQIARHGDLMIMPTAIDVDDDPIEFSFQWYVNGEANPLLTTDTLPKEQYVRGDKIRFTIATTDGISEGKLYQSETLTVSNAPPKIVSQPPATFEAFEYSYQVKVQDPDNDQLTFSFENPPPGMTISKTGKITWPLSGVQPGKYEIKILVRDPEGGEDRQEFVLTLGEPKG